MRYTAIARKYRPQTFASVIGQESIVRILRNAILQNRLAHAYLFCGTRGTGKTSLARLFAKALNCQTPTPEGEPCQICSSCQEITSGHSLDVLEIDGASNRGIDDIRQLNETVGYASASGKYKIYIIDEVHMLTKEAFNALLKTLEEPPPNVKFFFATTEPHKIPPTIISRCQRFDLNRIQEELIVKKLGEIAKDYSIIVEKEALELIAHLSEGSLRDAESLLDQILCYGGETITRELVTTILRLTPHETFFALDNAIARYELPYAFSLAKELFETGKDPSHFLEGLIEHFRIHLQFHLSAEFSLSLLSSQDKEKYKKTAGNYTVEQCLYLIEFLMHWIQQIQKTPLKKAILEMILLHLIRSQRRVSADHLVERLIAMEKALVADIAKEEKVSHANPYLAAPPIEEPPPKQLAEEASTKEEAPVEKPTKAKTKSVEKSSEKEPIPEAAKEEKKSPDPAPPQPAEKKEDLSKLDKVRLETMMRFAAVELEGTLKKESNY